ncbi:MAG: carbamate kinase [Nitrospirota bacterium]
MSETLLIALGGNALVQGGQRDTIADQVETLREALAGVVELIRRGYKVVFTHGNGPQVGHILLRAEAARGRAYDLPLDVCVAQSQGEIGYLIQQTLQNLLLRNGLGHRPVATVITRAVVDEADPRMGHPTKPIGPFYTKDQADRLRESGWTMIEDAHRGYRRVVPSPMPVRIVEADVIGRLCDQGTVVIACGGGGVPVRVAEDGTLAGIEAVVDKDLASSVLAEAIGIETILNLTAVEHVKLNFGGPDERDLPTLTVAEARTYLAQGHFAPGSMGSKIEAALRFLDHGGRRFIVTRPEKAVDALEGRTGTSLAADGPARRRILSPDRASKMTRKTRRR